MVNNEQLGEAEDFNMAKRVAMNIMPEFKRRELTSIPTYPFRAKENEEFYPVPDWVEVIPEGGDGVEQLNGGYSRAVQSFCCENVASPHQDFQCLQWYMMMMDSLP